MKIYLIFLLLVISNSLRAQDSLKVRTEVLQILEGKDSANYEAAADKYYHAVSQPYLKDNLDILLPLLLSTNSKVYQKYIQRDDLILKYGGIFTLEILKWKIFEDHISRYEGKSNNAKQWHDFIKLMGKKYGNAGEEITERYYFISLISDKADFVTFLSRIENYLDRNARIIHPNDVNEFCWNICDYSHDVRLLRQALGWMADIAKKTTQPELIDTYANLLYKTGNQKEAIIWQRKAVAIAPHNLLFSNVLQKMQEGTLNWNR